jgi:hypothetical protein
MERIEFTDEYRYHLTLNASWLSRKRPDVMKNYSTMTPDWLWKTSISIRTDVQTWLHRSTFLFM